MGLGVALAGSFTRTQNKTYPQTSGFIKNIQYTDGVTTGTFLDSSPYTVADTNDFLNLFNEVNSMFYFTYYNAAS